MRITTLLTISPYSTLSLEESHIGSLDENAKLRTISGKMSALNIIKYFVKLESTRKKSLIVALFLSLHKQLQMQIENTELKKRNVEM